MKKPIPFVLAALAFLPAASLSAQAADLDALLRRNENLPRPPATEARMRMTIENKAGQARVREIQAYSKNEADGTMKQTMVFLAPADVRDTRFLTIDYPEGGKADEQYIYMPALRKVRTIGTSGGDSKTGAFLGSDFTFADIGTLDRSDFSVRALGEEEIDGRIHVKVEYAPKDAAAIKKYGYGKILRWIDKERATSRRCDYYDAEGKLAKRLSVQGQEQVDGKYWQFKSMKMENLATGGATTWEFTESTNLPSIDDKFFAVRYIERGR